MFDIYKNFNSCKVISKNKLETLGVTEYLMEKYSNKQTKMQYREIDNIGLIKELCGRLENKPMSVVQQIKFEKEYLDDVVYKNEKVNQSYYIITDFKQ